ncbi:hypothetical protein DFH08DRAFT_896761, partial [Mycena albidolilacea]
MMVFAATIIGFGILRCSYVKTESLHRYLGKKLWRNSTYKGYKAESIELGRRPDTPSVDAGALTSSHWAAKISKFNKLN